MPFFRLRFAEIISIFKKKGGGVPYFYASFPCQEWDSFVCVHQAQKKAFKAEWTNSSDGR